ncbi:MAG: Na/Pi cotransporter family protein [Alphaproteobacteria bacterium]|nr:Na/Pi cotransporter family protein [Alphaproteobacteria bacterium]
MMAILTLAGGIGLFLLGMGLLTDGLKIAAGGALRTLLQTWTKSSVRGFALGVLITAVVQSSSAVTVATVGFVNARLLSLRRAVWVILGTNVGTTMTGWLVALVGVKVDVGALALPLIGIGMALALGAGERARLAGSGRALAGFGLFFLGVGVLQEGFGGLAPALAAITPETAGIVSILVFVVIGALVTVLTQSSSAAIAIILTASTGGAFPLELAAAAVIGANLGTTSTAAFAVIGAGAPARRVASAHIAFNLFAAAVALAAMPLFLPLARELAGLVLGSGDVPATLALFHTLFNVAGVALAWPLVGRTVAWLSTRFVTEDETLARPVHLDPTSLPVPSLALNALSQELVRMTGLTLDLVREAAAPKPMAKARLKLRRDGLMQLGEEVRTFLARMNASALPGSVTAAVPDLVRALQHLEELAMLSAEIAPDTAPPGRFGQSEAWTGLQDALDGVLALHVPGLDEVGFEREAARLERDFQSGYSAVKTELLKGVASGELAVGAVDAALMHARRIRQICDTVIKTHRRLHPWRPALAVAETGPTQAEPASAKS